MKRMLPKGHPYRWDDDYLGRVAGDHVGHYVQRDSAGAFRVVTHNYRGEILKVSDPLPKMRNALDEIARLGVEPSDALREYDELRQKKYLLFGHTWDGKDVWEM